MWTSSNLLTPIKKGRHFFPLSSLLRTHPPFWATSGASSFYIHPSWPTPTFSRPQPSSTPPLLFTSSSGEAERFTPCGWDSLAALIVAGTRPQMPNRLAVLLSRGTSNLRSATRPSSATPERRAPRVFSATVVTPRPLATPEHSGSCSFLAHSILAFTREKTSDKNYNSQQAQRRSSHCVAGVSCEAPPSSAGEGNVPAGGYGGERCSKASSPQKEA